MVEGFRAELQGKETT